VQRQRAKVRHGEANLTTSNNPASNENRATGLFPANVYQVF